MIIISVIWLVPVCIQTPWALFYEQREYTHLMRVVCMPDFPSDQFERGFFLGVVFLTCYLVPLCLISIFYAMVGIKVWKRSVSGIKGTQTEKNIQRSKIRIVRMLITVTVVFAMAWLPLYSIRMRILFGPQMSAMERNIVLNFIVPIAQWLGSATSAVNPVIYCYFSEQFRKSIVAVMQSGSCSGRITPWLMWSVLSRNSDDKEWNLALRIIIIKMNLSANPICYLLIKALSSRKHISMMRWITHTRIKQGCFMYV